MTQLTRDVASRTPDKPAPTDLWVPPVQQWLATTAGRIAQDGYSWMQAVHWVAAAGLYVPRRAHGPGFNPTTVFIAQLLAELSPCRPGIDYLMRRTRLSERSVQYHLQMLRESGLLAYIERGTRVRGDHAHASEFAHTIPTEFDNALGIKTVGEGPARRMTGMAPSPRSRNLMKRLAKKAARKLRRRHTTTSPKSHRPTRKPTAGEKLCTPMQVASSTVPSAASTSFPSESKLASGRHKSPSPKRSTKADGRKLNHIGRRYQLARELTQELDWLRNCSVPRIAWVARHVADAGWTVTDVKGWLHLRGEAGRVRRGSGLLATLLSNAHNVLDTPAKRADAVEQWRCAQEAARRYRIQQVRARQERFEGDWDAPTSLAVQRLVNEAFTTAFSPKPVAATPVTEALPEASEPQGLDAEEVVQLRAEARKRLIVGDTSLVTVAVEVQGRDSAEQLYGAELVRRALQLASGARSTLMTYGRR
ncbi:winged helix-turn-helix domain-containing protein [Streptomyces sp. NPDC056975]|uniref:helix-turn-helix domain-containing protein n=1 Tax=Streptomyces sp. NPDC056975 TaxID=3345985 RepID=UPI00363B11B3